MGCIYCNGEPYADEHWLPRFFGRFNYPLLKERICETCNGMRGLGQLDLAVVRTGPEGVFRALRAIQGRQESTVNPVYYKAASDQPVRITATGPSEPEIFYEPYNDHGEMRARPARQIVVEDDSGARHAVPISLAWTPEILKGALEHRGLRDVKLVEIYLDVEDREPVRQLLSGVFPGFSAESYARNGHVETKRVMFESRLAIPFFRGIAKIAFHYALKFIPEIRGDERCFQPVRDFIRHGVGNVDDFITDGTGAYSFIPKGKKPVRWGHFFAVISDDSGVVVRLQLFVGPLNVPLPWIVTLCKEPATKTPVSRGHVALYFDDAPRPDGDGELVEIEVSDRPPHAGSAADHIPLT